MYIYNYIHTNNVVLKATKTRRGKSILTAIVDTLKIWRLKTKMKTFFQVRWSKAAVIVESKVVQINYQNYSK